MYLAEYSRNAERAARQRSAVRRRGYTGTGQKVWEDWEDQLCRKFSPDYQVLLRKLPHRSYAALRRRCQFLGLRPRRTRITARQVTQLRTLFPNGSSEALLAAFPGLTMQQIRMFARYYGIRRGRRRLRATGIPIIDAIRERCFECNYSMVDLDDIAKTRRYFQAQDWHSCGLNYRAIGKAVAALDGELSVNWRAL
jgi:uncharacterized protein (DUF433 family)